MKAINDRELQHLSSGSAAGKRFVVKKSRRYWACVDAQGMCRIATWRLPDGARLADQTDVGSVWVTHK
jgi:hypothetical protein